MGSPSAFASCAGASASCAGSPVAIPGSPRCTRRRTALSLGNSRIQFLFFGSKKEIILLYSYQATFIDLN